MRYRPAALPGSDESSHTLLPVRGEPNAAPPPAPTPSGPATAAQLRTLPRNYTADPGRKHLPGSAPDSQAPAPRTPSIFLPNAATPGSPGSPPAQRDSSPENTRAPR